MLCFTLTLVTLETKFNQLILSIDQERFGNIIVQHEPPSLSGDVHQDVNSVCAMLYGFSRECQTRRRVCGGHPSTDGQERWLEWR